MLHIFWVLICCWINMFYLWASCLFLIYDVFFNIEDFNVLTFTPLWFVLYPIFLKNFFQSYNDWGLYFFFFWVILLLESLLFYQSLTLRNTTFSLNNISLPSSMLLLLNIVVALYLKTSQILFFFFFFTVHIVIGMGEVCKVKLFSAGY